MVLMVRNLPANAGDTRDVSLIAGSGGSLGIGNEDRIINSAGGTAIF